MNLRQRCWTVVILLCINTTTCVLIADSESTETENENDGGFKSILPSSAWSPWKEQQKSIDSIILPIVSAGEKLRSGSNAPLAGSDASLFGKTSSALLGFAGEGLNQLKNSSVVNQVSSFIDQRIPENVKTNVEATGMIIGNTISGLGDIAFPEGENTSLIDGVSNVVNELKATHKELEQWPIQDTIVNSLSEQASKLFGFSPENSQTEKTGALLEIETDAEFEGDTIKFTGDPKSSGEGISNKKIVVIILIVLAILSVISLIINLILTGYLVRNKKKLNRMKNFVNALPIKDQHLQEQQSKLLQLDRVQV